MRLNLRVNQLIRYGIIQDVKRLRTVPVVQQNPIPEISQEIFESAGVMKIIQVKGAFERLLLDTPNDVQTMEHSDLFQLQVGTKVGLFKVEMDPSQRTLFYTSPFNGVFKYYYDPAQSRFVSNKDGHNFDENISREVMYKMTGFFYL